MPTTELLHDHGTRIAQLPPSAIVTTAANDLTLLRKKKELLADPAEHYAFVAKHVRKAVSPADLIQRAINDLDRGTKSGKLNTRILYGSPEVLRAALDHARGGAE